MLFWEIMNDLKFMIWNKTWIPEGYWRAIICNSLQKATYCWLCTRGAGIYLGCSWVLWVINSSGSQVSFESSKDGIDETVSRVVFSKRLSHWIHQFSKLSQKSGQLFFSYLLIIIIIFIVFPTTFPMKAVQNPLHLLYTPKITFTNTWRTCINFLNG